MKRLKQMLNQNMTWKGFIKMNLVCILISLGYSIWALGRIFGWKFMFKGLHFEHRDEEREEIDDLDI